MKRKSERGISEKVEKWAGEKVSKKYSITGSWMYIVCRLRQLCGFLTFQRIFRRRFLRNKLNDAEAEACPVK